MVSLAEYHANQGERLSETDLRSNEVYTSMLLLEVRSKASAAARVGARVLSLDTDYGGLVVAQVEFLDNDFQAETTNILHITDGFIQHIEEDMQVKQDQIITDVATGYFKSYHDEYDDYLLCVSRDLQLEAISK